MFILERSVKRAQELSNAVIPVNDDVGCAAQSAAVIQHFRFNKLSVCTFLRFLHLIQETGHVKKIRFGATLTL